MAGYRPGHAGNGPATAALVLGVLAVGTLIVSPFVLVYVVSWDYLPVVMDVVALLLSLVALVLAAIGQGQAKRTGGAGQGRVGAAIALGVVAILLSATYEYWYWFL